MLLVNVENDGEQDATDFRLDVEFPTVFLDGSGYVIQIPLILPASWPLPGWSLFRVDSSEGHERPALSSQSYGVE